VLLDESDAQVRPSQQQGGERAGRAAADDQNIEHFAKSLGSHNAR
jgi:hypothetical protein